MKLGGIATHHLPSAQVRWIADLCSLLARKHGLARWDCSIEKITSDLSELERGVDAGDPGFIGGLCCFLPDSRVQIWISDSMGQMSREYLVHELAHALLGQLPETTGHTIEWRRFYLLAFAHCLDEDLEHIESYVEYIVGEYRDRACTRRERLGKHTSCRECRSEVQSEVQEHLAAIKDYSVTAALARGDAAAYDGMRLTLTQMASRETLCVEVLGIGLSSLSDKIHAVGHLARPLQRVGKLCLHSNLSKAIQHFELYDDSAEAKLAILEKDGDESEWLLAPWPQSDNSPQSGR